ncbi:MAG: hypothetical protein WCW33_01210 [Candidatus Babeliales bacterium]|jgi:hypothetical protein
MKKQIALCALVSQFCIPQLLSMASMDLDQIDTHLEESIFVASHYEVQKAEISELVSTLAPSDQNFLVLILENQIMCVFDLIGNHCNNHLLPTNELLSGLSVYNAFIDSQPSVPTVEGILPDSISDFQIELMRHATNIVQNTLIATQGKHNSAETERPNFRIKLINLARLMAYPRSPTYTDTFNAYVLLEFSNLILFALDLLANKVSPISCAPETQQCLRHLQQRGAYHDKLVQAQKNFHTGLMAYATR